jgi:putative FmdB family regulatory protein
MALSLVTVGLQFGPNYIDPGLILAYPWLYKPFVAKVTGGCMPIFDFLCKECGCDFEVLVRGSASPACPECGGTQVEKQVALPAPQGKTKGIVAQARRQAAREGHFSNYATSERPRRK